MNAIEHLTRPPMRALTLLTRGGRRVALRRVTPEDTALLADLLLRLSPRARQHRYLIRRSFSLETAWAEAERMVDGHAGRHLTLVAAVNDRGFDEAVAVAELAPDPQEPAVGHLAVVVRDDRQGDGLGGALVRELTRDARAAGFTVARADLLAENRAALRLLDALGQPQVATTSHGETRVFARLPDPREGAESRWL